MGEELRGPTHSNRLGYFEDMEFLGFHKELMARCQVDRYTPWVELELLPEDYKRGSELLEQRKQRRGSWGWKDPRATMFMDFWTEIDPALKFLVMYRDPREVMTSMYREQRRRIRYRHPTYAPRTWIVNNLQAIDFALRHPGRVAFLDLKSLKEAPGRAIAALSEWLGRRLSIDVWKEVYRPGELRASRRSQVREPVISALARFAIAFYGAEMQHVYRLLTDLSLVSAETKDAAD